MKFSDQSRFAAIASGDKGLSLFTEHVWSVSLKREIRVLCLVKHRKAAQPSLPVVLFPPDLELDPQELLRLYRSRFHIEFLFRDAKQSVGLGTCQVRDQQALSFQLPSVFDEKHQTTNFQ